MGSRNSKTSKSSSKQSIKSISKGDNCGSSLIVEILSRTDCPAKIMNHLRIHPNTLNVIYEAPEDMETSVVIERLIL